jgi:hypothetical protein
MFSAGQIALSSAVGGVVSFVALLIYPRLTRKRAPFWGQSVLVAAVVVVSILLGRASGNTAMLNDDPIPLVSPNDVLCPMLTYVCLGLYAGLWGTADWPDWPRVRALLTIISFIVNVVTI